MKRSIDRPTLLFSRSSLVVLALALGVGWSAAPARPTPSAEESEAFQPSTAEFTPPIECWFHNRFPLLDEAIERTSALRRVRLYYRCSSYADFYFVDMSPQGGSGYRAVAPMAEESCPSVFYYVEAVEENFSSTRSVEREAEVTSDTECRRRDPAAAWFVGNNPGIVVGATREGAAPIPPGFRADGITGFIGPAEASLGTGAGGGGGPGPIVLGAAAAAGGGAIALAASGGDSTESTTSMGPPAGMTSTSVAASTSAPTTSAPTTTVGSGPRACFTTDPSPPVITAGESIRLDGRCSTGASTYLWDLGDGRRRDSGLINPIYRVPGMFTVTLTVSDGMRSDSRSTVVTVEPVVTTTIYFQPLTRTKLSYRSVLGANGFDGTTVGVIIANGQHTSSVTNGAPGEFRIEGAIGKNSISAYIASGEGPEGFWRFDFNGEPDFVSGSLSVRRGQVLALEPRAVVFRLEDGARTFVEFDFQVVP